MTLYFPRSRKESRMERKSFDFAPFPKTYVNNGTPSYVDNDSSPGILGCVDNTSICDLWSEVCWNILANRPEEFRSYLDFYRMQFGSTKLIGPNNGLLPAHYNVLDPLGILDKPTAARRTEAELAYVLLANSLTYSTACFKFFVWTTFDLREKCGASILCTEIPLDQWKAEARSAFETSLAQIQFNVLDFVRGRKWMEDFGGVPPRYRGLCKMGKFHSVGWRNVSFWGLLGLLSLAGGVSLAGVRTKDEELWLVIGPSFCIHGFRWAWSKTRELPWEGHLGTCC